MACIFTVSGFFVGGGAALLVASMGASAVLLFAAPKGPLSQPWPVLGGHVIAATIGVFCAKQFGDTQLAAALAVGLTIGVTQLLHCLHPPGGATALTAVVGGEAVTRLGFAYVLTPVLINVVIILLCAVLFHAPRKNYPLKPMRAFRLRRLSVAEAEVTLTDSPPPGA